MLLMTALPLSALWNACICRAQTIRQCHLYYKFGIHINNLQSFIDQCKSACDREVLMYGWCRNDGDHLQCCQNALTHLGGQYTHDDKNGSSHLTCWPRHMQHSDISRHLPGSRFSDVQALHVCGICKPPVTSNQKDLSSKTLSGSLPGAEDVTMEAMFCPPLQKARGHYCN